VGDCNGAALCQYNCTTQASFMNQARFGALAECAEDNDCEDEQCIAANCADEAMACGL
jgi:hypothetical protein